VLFVFIVALSVLIMVSARTLLVAPVSQHASIFIFFVDCNVFTEQVMSLDWG